MTALRTVRLSFGTDPFSLSAVADLFRGVGEVRGADLRSLAARLGVPADGYQMKAVADLLGLSDEPRELPELYAAARRLLESSSREGPLEIVFHNVECAGPAFFNLVAYLESSLEGEVSIVSERGDTRPVWPTDPHELRARGMRSLRRSDMPAAHAYLTRAADAFGPGHDRLGCLAASCDALLAGDRPDDALRVAERGMAEAAAANDDVNRARFGFFVTMLGDAEVADVEIELARIAQILGAAGDDAGSAQAAEALGHLRAAEGDEDGAMSHMERALALAHSAGDKQTSTRIAAWMCDALAQQPDATVAIGSVEALGWIDHDSALIQIKRLVTLALLHKRAGDIDRGRGALEVALRIQNDVGQPRWVAGIPESGRIEDL